MYNRTMWQTILGISLFLSSVAVIFQKKVHNIPESNPIKFAIAFQFVTGLLIFLYGLFTNQLVYGNLSTVWINILLMTLLYAAGNTLYFQGLKLTEASIYTVICSSSAIYAVLGSTIFLHQFLNLKQGFGLVIMLGSIVIINRIKGKIVFTKGALLTMLGAVAMGLAMVNDKFVLEHFSVYAYLSLAFVLPSILMAIIFRKQRGSFKLFVQKNVFPRFIAFCVAFALQTVTFFVALKMTTNSSQFAGMALFGNVLTVVMSMIFLRETNRIKPKIIALLLGIVGLVLIS